jgi:hypothetical protein
MLSALEGLGGTKRGGEVVVLKKGRRVEDFRIESNVPHATMRWGTRPNY